MNNPFYRIVLVLLFITIIIPGQAQQFQPYKSGVIAYHRITMAIHFNCSCKPGG